MGKVGHAASNWWDQVNPIEQYKAVGDTLEGIMTHPGQTLTKIGAANDAPRVAAVDAFKRGDYVEWRTARPQLANERDSRRRYHDGKSIGSGAIR